MKNISSVQRTSPQVNLRFPCRNMHSSGLHIIHKHMFNVFKSIESHLQPTTLSGCKYGFRYNTNVRLLRNAGATLKAYTMVTKQIYSQKAGTCTKGAFKLKNDMLYRNHAAMVPRKKLVLHSRT